MHAATSRSTIYCVTTLILLLPSGCGSNETPAPTDSEAEIRIKQYDEEAKRRKANPPKGAWRSQFNIELEDHQRTAIESITEKIGDRLPNGANSQIKYKAMKTGAPDHLLLANVWLTGKLDGDQEARQYELTFIWQEGRWKAFSGSSQVIGELSKTQDAKQYDGAWVENAINRENTEPQER